MPDSRHHRGPAPGDLDFFNESTLPALRAATADLSLLLTRGYALPSAVKLVGDRYALTARQRTAVWRCACPDDALARRLSTKVPPDAVAGRSLVIDGYNLLLTLESALGGATLLLARDTTLRDLAAVHGTYRKVDETLPALDLLGRALESFRVPRATILLDAPVSNSGRLKQLILTLAKDRNWDWQVILDNAPDKLLAASTDVIATADSALLDKTPAWLNLAREIVARHLPAAPVVDLAV